MFKEHALAENELRKYKGLTKLVESIQPNVNISRQSPFEQFSARLQKLLRDREPTMKEASESKEYSDDESKSMEGGGHVVGGALIEDDLPSILELRAIMIRDHCHFLEVLSKMMDFYIDPSVEEITQKILNDTYEQSVFVAQAIQAVMQFLSTKDASVLEPYLAFYETLRTVVDPHDAEELQNTFIGQGTDYEEFEKLNDALQEEGLVEYPTLFYLYILALRDWVNCIENISKPLECPQIPPNLRRNQVQCPSELPTSL